MNQPTPPADVAKASADAHTPPHHDHRAQADPVDTDPAVDARYRAAVRLATEAGHRTLTPFRALSFDVEIKTDGSVVTEIDRDTELFLRDAILSEFPDDGVLGEEHGEVTGTSGYRWVLDPIDGTESFVRGVPLYGTLVAVQRLRGQSEPQQHGRALLPESVIGVVRMPALGEGVSAAVGRGAWHHRDGEADVPARVSRVDSLGSAMVTFTSYRYFEISGRGYVADRLHASGMNSRGWSDCYAHVLCATGRIDVVVEPGVHVWDVAPMTVIMSEAGGRGTDWRGAIAADSNDFVCSNGLLHDAVLGLLHGE